MPAATADGDAVSSRPGRKLDETRNATILDATLAVLAEVGYDIMTIDMVAERSHTARATVYRRWTTKADLAVAAVTHLSETDARTQKPLPDTGTLRGDLLANQASLNDREQDLRIRVMSGLVTLTKSDPRLAGLTAGAGLEPWVAASRALLQKAVDRGEYAAVDVDVLGQVMPMLCMCRLAIQETPITSEFVTSLIDNVILPAMGPRLRD